MKKYFVLFSLVFLCGCALSSHNHYQEALNSGEEFVDDYALAVVDNKYGFVDKNNKFVVHPVYASAQNAPGDYFFVCNDFEGDKCAYMNKKTGKILTDFKYLGCGNGDISEGFSESMAKVVINKNGKWFYGYIDKSGKEVIAPQYRHGGSFSEGLANVMLDNGLYQYIDLMGKVVLPPKYEYATPFKDGIAKVRFNQDIGEKLYSINKQGKVVN